jgi:protein-S-isoprenylcysteine O-methyltransferase Ste14
MTLPSNTRNSFTENLGEGWTKLRAPARRKFGVSLSMMIGLSFALPSFESTQNWLPLIHSIWTFTGLALFGAVYLLIKNPEVINARSESHQGTVGWDKVWVTTYMVCYLLVLVLAVAEYLPKNQSSISPDWWPIGALLTAIGYFFVVWAMSNNEFFEMTVRIQNDRGHRVIDNGAYSLVRHPGYTGMIIMFGGQIFLYGSIWAAWMMLVMTAMLVLRTWLEDRTLQKDLKDYKAYTKRVRYRILPGIW